jgi:hypothetical protein
MSASRQSPKIGPQPKRDWHPPRAAVLPIRATASSWGFKWDSAWGGGKSSSVSPGRPNGPTPTAAPRPRAPGAADIAGQGRWESPALSVLPIRATANSWSWTWDHSWGGQKSSSFEPLPPKRSTDGASMVGTAITKVSDPLARLWQAPALDVLPLAATANSWSWTWDHSWGGQKSSSFEPAPPKRSSDSVDLDRAASVAGVSDMLGRLWQAPAVDVLPVKATAHTFGIKWDLYLGGGKMEGFRPQAPTLPLLTTSIGTSGVPARVQGAPTFWQAPAVASLSIRSTRAKGG